MSTINVVFLLVSIITVSIFSMGSNGSAYAQNGSNTGLVQPPAGGSGVTSSPNVPFELCLSQASREYWIGCSIGVTFGAGLGSPQGVSDRDSGLELDPTINYQPPTQEMACILYQDVSNSPCDTSQQMNDFFQGFELGYRTAYAYGYTSGYLLDEAFPSQPQPGQQQFPMQ